MAESEVTPTPSAPSSPVQYSNEAGIVPADPDLILFDESVLPIDIMSDLIFEEIGGQELINISRNDLLNGQRISYTLISNTDKIAQQYGPKNFIKIPGSLGERFKNFAIRLSEKIPSNGTGPAAFYVGPLGSNGCTDYPVLNRYNDALIACYPTYEEAQNAIDNDLAPKRPMVYSDVETGDIVVDLINVRRNELVDVEILDQGSLENDTIY